MYDACGETEVKILLALDPGDAKLTIARKIDENRETVRRAVNRLRDSGFLTYDEGLSLVDESVREAGLSFLTSCAALDRPTIREAYVLPQFAGMDFAYAGIDAVYVWTRGGYQVARDEDDYPLFVAVRETDLEAWDQFFDRFGIPTTRERLAPEDVDGPIQVVLETPETLQTAVVDGRPVVSLSDTVDFARTHYATFEPALAMLDRMYDDVDTAEEYRTEVSSP